MADTQSTPASPGGGAAISSLPGSRDHSAAVRSSPAPSPDGDSYTDDSRAIPGIKLRPYQALDIVRMRRAYGAGAKEWHDLRRCAACGAVSLPAPFCSNCGAPPKPATPSSLELWLELTSTPGLAAELRAMTYAQVVAWSDTPTRARIAEMVRGFKKGWAWHRTREIEERGNIA
jgi:hypothetical protein